MYQDGVFRAVRCCVVPETANVTPSGGWKEGINGDTTGNNAFTHAASNCNAVTVTESATNQPLSLQVTNWTPPDSSVRAHARSKQTIFYVTY